jgi:hypothetical protein
LILNVRNRAIIKTVKNLSDYLGENALFFLFAGVYYIAVIKMGLP